MRLKKIITLLITGSLALPLLGYAKSLTIINNNIKLFTVRVNNLCSSEFGVLKKHESKTVQQDSLIKLCGKNGHRCQASMFLSSDCTGEEIASFLFDAQEGFLYNTSHCEKNYAFYVSYPSNSVTLTKTDPDESIK